MNLKNKKSFISLELILTLFLAILILINTSIFLKDIYFNNKANKKIAINTLDLQSSKIFLEKNSSDIHLLLYKNNNLYFKNALLLEDIKNFTINKNKNFINIKFFKDSKNIFWIIKR